MKFYLAGLVTGLTMLAFSGNAKAQSLVNPNFEILGGTAVNATNAIPTSVTPGTVTTTSSGWNFGASAAASSATGATYSWITPDKSVSTGGLPAGGSLGNYSLLLVSTTSVLAFAQQTLAFTPGNSYAINLDAALQKNGGGGFSISFVDAVTGSTIVSSTPFTLNGNNTAMTNVTFSITLPQGTYSNGVALRFQETVDNGGAKNLEIDNVTISVTATSQVPEPATIAAVGLLLGMVGFAERRRFGGLLKSRRSAQ